MAVGAALKLAITPVIVWASVAAGVLKKIKKKELLEIP